MTELTALAVMPENYEMIDSDWNFAVAQRPTERDLHVHDLIRIREQVPEKAFGSDAARFH